jgi:heme-degrading monooxygenase HmoA
MAIMMLMEVPGGTVEQYARTNEILGINGEDDAPEGLIYHATGLTNDGMVIVDLWRSQDDLEHFFERLAPALEEAGVPKAEPQFHDVHAHVSGTGETAGAIVILEFEDFGPEDYDAMSSSMDSHSTGTHPAVSHVAAVRSDGTFVVVDIWESPEAFAAFAEKEIAPAGEQIGLGPMEPRIHPVHSTLRGKATAA